MSPQQIVYKSKSWKDFEKKVSKLSYKERGTAFEWLCKFYLMIHPVYRLSYKRVLHSSEFLKNKLITKRLGLDSIEEGTDLIGETFEGKYEIIQCKYKDDKNKNLTAKDINSSISVATGKEASKWVDTILMCSNLQGLTSNKRLQEQHKIQFRTLLAGEFEALSKDDFNNIKKVIDNAIPEYEPKFPRKHQEKAIKAIQDHFKKNKRGQLIHACGTGKTLTSYFTFREITPKLTLFVVPSLQLINQTLIEWSKESLADDSPISPLVICSDLSNEKISENEPQLWLQELGIKVSNDIKDIEKFLSSRRKNKVIFSTYQSGKILAKHLTKLGKSVDLAFFDEAHNTATSKSKLFSYLLSDKNLNIKKRLFMTATPKKLVGKDDRFLSMDDVDTYGEVIDEITVKDAIEDLKLLNDYKIVTQLIDDSLMKKLLKDNPFVIDEKALPEQVELRLISSAITLKKIMREKKIKNVVSFHGRINRARAFQSGINKIFKEQVINTYHVNGKQSGTVRQGILDDFASNPPSLVTNSQCLSEGVNVPSIDAIMFVDPKQSRVDITQAIGRALRKGKKAKGYSYIIVPIVVNKKNSDYIEEAYQQILMVLRSMSEHDGRIVESYKLIADGKKPTKNFLEVDTEYFPQEFDLNEFTKTLNVKAWNRFSKLGRRPFEQAREWARGLGITSTQWRSFSKTKNKPPDIPAGPDKAYAKEWIDWRDFLGNPSEREEMNTLIYEYKKYAKGKTIPVPPDEYVTKSGFRLGTKIRGMRNSYKENILPQWKVDIVQKELVDKNIFDWDGQNDFRWKYCFNAYVKFVKKTGEARPERGKKYDGIILETWFLTQKAKYREALGLDAASRGAKLKDWQFKMLKEINFEFEYHKVDRWMNNFNEYKELIAKYKGKIPFDAKPNKWISEVRKRYKQGLLEKEKIKLIESIDGWMWSPFQEKFDNNFDNLIEFVERNKITNPKTNKIYKGTNLSKFLVHLRHKYRKGKLDKKYENRLKKIGVKLIPSRKVGSVNYYD